MITKHEAILHLSRNVKFAMEEHGLTIRALATAVEAPHTTIQTLIGGENEPSYTLMLKIATHFGLSMGDFALKSAEFRKLFRERSAAS